MVTQHPNEASRVARGLLVTTGPKEGLVEIGVSDTAQLFDRFDQSSPAGRHLDSKIDQLIVHLAEERPSASYVLSVRIRELTPSPTDARALATVIREHFDHRAHEASAKFGFLVSNGRRDLVVGFLFLFICGTIGLVAGKVLPTNVGGLVQEGFVIIGWVALWSPVDLFLYELRPLRRERDLLRALRNMEVRFEVH